MARRHREQKRGLSGLIALVLFGVFAVCILSVLLTGAHVYRSLTARDQETYACRTGIQYVATKIRQSKSQDTVEVSDFDGVQALSLSEKIGGEQYVTRVYCYDGWLRELFSAEGGDFLPENGEKIIEARDLDLGLEDGLLTIRLADDHGTYTELTMSLRGRGSAG